MPPQSREFNDRFKAHIAQAERVRRIFVMTLVTTCLVGGTGVAFAMVAPPGSSARAELTNQLAAAGGAASSFSWIGDWLFSMFGREEAPPPLSLEDTAAPVRSPAPTPTPTARVEQASSTTIVAAPTVPLRQPAPTVQQTIVNQPVIERIVERATTPAGVSEERLNLRLADVTQLLRAEFSSAQVSYSGASAPVSTQTFAQSQRSTACRV